jgi:hypothetical protein
MRVTIEVGDGQELCSLLDREIGMEHTRSDILPVIRKSLTEALDFELRQIKFVLSDDNAEPTKRGAT